MKYKRKKGKSITKVKKFRYNGVDYKSGLERYMAVLLTENNIEFKYEPKKFKLMEGFFFQNESYERQANGKGDFIDRGSKKVQPITYTPDFVGEGFLIETKGWANEEFRNKWKMFKNYVKNNNLPIILFKPQNQNECKKVIEKLISLKS